jgi:hypothetical protein
VKFNEVTYRSVHRPPLFSVTRFAGPGAVLPWTMFSKRPSSMVGDISRYGYVAGMSAAFSANVNLAVLIWCFS